MCRSMSEGGRRCPCASGDRRRAYARSRYAARNAEAARRAANAAEFTRRFVEVQERMQAALAEGEQDLAGATALDLDPAAAPAPEVEPDPELPPPLGTVVDALIEDRYSRPIAEMSDEDCEQVRAYATVRAQLSAEETRTAYAAMAGLSPYSDSPQRRAYEAALQEEGRHLAAVADVTLHEHLRRALPDPDDRDAVGSPAWVARVVVDADFAHQDGTVMTAHDVYTRIRDGRLDREAAGRFQAMTRTLLDAQQLVRTQRSKAHAAALRSTLEQANPDLSFGTTDLSEGAQPVVWGTGMTKAKQAQFVDSVHSAYPDQLVERARDNGRPLRVRVTSSRAHYQPSGAHERVPAAHYLDASDLIAAARAVDHEADDETDAETRSSRIQLNAGYASRYTEARSAPPSRGGVPDTAANRAALEAAFAAWSPSHNPYMDKRFAAKMGSSPEIRAVDGMLFVVSKKRVPPLSGNPVAELTTNGADNVTVHEMAHRIEEQAPAIATACHAFLARRTAGLDPTVYNTGVRRGRRVVETVREDSFVDPYIGRDYGPNQPHTEVFSVGMEALATGRFGGLTDNPESGWAEQQRRADPEHRQLVLALLASAPRLLDSREADR